MNTLKVVFITACLIIGSASLLYVTAGPKKSAQTVEDQRATFPWDQEYAKFHNDLMGY